MHRETIFLAVLLVFIGAMFGFGSDLGMRLQTVLAGPVPAETENTMLATISQSIEGYGLVRKTAEVPSGKTVPVFSRYPLNLKSEILIAAGDKDGIRAGDVVLFQGALLGSVERVYKDTAIVSTIFDSRFKTPVRIGEAGADALLVGGPEPKLTLIPSSSKVGENDQVYVAGEGLPYGTALGALRDLTDSHDNIYRSATLRVFYNPASLTAVTVVPKSGS